MLVVIPRNTNYKKIRKNVRFKKGKDFKMNVLDNKSTCGLKVLESGTISMTVFEAVRRIIKKKTKKQGILKVNGFPNISVTKKPIGLRMGKGVGNIELWVFPVKKGRILFELIGVPVEIGRIALMAAAHKLNLSTKILLKLQFKEVE